jgi:predicted ATP-binding protein involved in virulence
LELTSGDTFWRLNIEKTFAGINSEGPPSSLIFYAYGAGRRLRGVSLRQEPLDDPVGTLFDENALLRNAEEWLLQLDYAASKKSDNETLQEAQLERVKSLLISILTDDIKDIRFATTGGVYPKARVEFQTFSGWVPLHRLGYGYQTLIAWVTDFASRMMERYPDSPDPFKEAAIVLVDEIDLHLHPLWQRKLIADLTKHFPNTQFIATAHSPLVVQAAENANIAVLKRVGDHVEIINDPEQIRGWRIDQILTSDLFGLESARSPEIEALIKRKQELLTKNKQSARDKAELRELQAKIDKLPVGDSAQNAKEMETIREAIDLLKDQLPK